MGHRVGISRRSQRRETNYVDRLDQGGGRPRVSTYAEEWSLIY